MFFPGYDAPVVLKEKETVRDFTESEQHNEREHEVLWLWRGRWGKERGIEEN